MIERSKRKNGRERQKAREKSDRLVSVKKRREKDVSKRGKIEKGKEDREDKVERTEIEKTRENEEKRQ